jgi:hypothetical protein
MDENQDERASADDNGAEPAVQQAAVVAVVVAEPTDQGVRYRLQFQPGAISDPVGFCMMLTQLAAGNAAQFYQKQQQAEQQAIQVPRIQLPGNLDLKGGGLGPGGPPIQFRGRRGKGRG